MDSSGIKDRLSLLNSVEAETLYWKCQGLTDEGISNKTGDSKSQARILWTNALATVRPYGLGVELREAIEAMAGNPPRFDPWPPLEPPKEESESLAYTAPPETPPATNPPPPIDPTPTSSTGQEADPFRPRGWRDLEPRNLLLWVFGGIFLVGAALAVLQLLGVCDVFRATCDFSILTNDPVEPVAEAPVVEAATEIVPTPELPTPEPATPEPPTIEPTIDAAATELINLAATAEEATALFIANLPTNTPEPTDTPRPTLTPTPEPLFFTNFDGSDTDTLAVEGENFAITDNTLIARGRLKLVIEGADWTNYIVSVDVPVLDGSHFGRGFEIQVRRQDDINYMALQIKTEENLMFGGRCDFRWVSVVDGVETPVDGGSGNVGGANSGAQCQGHWDIYLQDNLYSVFKEGDRYNRAIDGTYSDGGVAIANNEDGVVITMDSVEVSTLP